MNTVQYNTYTHTQTCAPLLAGHTMQEEPMPLESNECFHIECHPWPKKRKMSNKHFSNTKIKLLHSNKCH